MYDYDDEEEEGPPVQSPHHRPQSRASKHSATGSNGSAYGPGHSGSAYGPGHSYGAQEDPFEDSGRADDDDMW